MHIVIKACIYKFDITQSINIFDNIRLDLGYQYKHTKSYHNESFNLGINYIF